MTGPVPWQYHQVLAAIGANPDDTNPTWTDITPYVDSVVSPVSVQSGRPTEQVTAEPSNLTLVLNNTDHRFTFGNASSPYAPYWRQGLKIRVIETIGYRSYPAFTGWLEESNIDDWAPPGVDQQITVTVIDRLTRVDRSRVFISTLAEYILYNGGSALLAYYPFNESSKSFRDVTGNNNPYLKMLSVVGSGFTVTSQAAAIQPAQGAPVLADDGATVALVAGLGTNAGTNVWATVPNIEADGYGLGIGSGFVLTVVCWLNLSAPATPYSIATQLLSIGTLNCTLITSCDALGMVSVLVSGAMSASATVAPFPVSGWTPLAIRFGPSANLLEVWIGNQRFPATLTGTLASDTLNSIQLPEIQGALGHVQVYIGHSADWDLPQLAAQIVAARTCLTGQYTGQRIKTLFQYAGVPASELSNVDNGVAMMGIAKLAGTTPYTKATEAEQTEQGRLYADGNGLVVFQDRHRRYNR